MIDIGFKIYYVDLMKNSSLYGRCRIACRAITELLSVISNTTTRCARAMSLLERIGRLYDCKWSSDACWQRPT